jgi:hypothetical protein
MRWYRLTERLLCGAVPEAREDDQLLRGLGVARVINCVEEPANQRSCWAGPQLLLPQVDDGGPRDPRQLLRALDYYRGAGVVYVHCWEGRRRGPATAYAVLRGSGYGREEAEKMLTGSSGSDAWKVYHESVENFIFEADRGKI